MVKLCKESRECITKREEREREGDRWIRNEVMVYTYCPGIKLYLKFQRNRGNQYSLKRKRKVGHSCFIFASTQAFSSHASNKHFHRKPKCVRFSVHASKNIFLSSTTSTRRVDSSVKSKMIVLLQF